MSRTFRHAYRNDNTPGWFLALAFGLMFAFWGGLVALVVFLLGLLFEHDLWVYLGKDDPFLLDCLAGFFCSPVLIPLAIFGAVLSTVGYATPFIR